MGCQWESGLPVPHNPSRDLFDVQPSGDRPFTPPTTCASTDESTRRTTALTSLSTTLPLPLAGKNTNRGRDAVASEASRERKQEVHRDGGHEERDSRKTCTLSVVKQRFLFFSCYILLASQEAACIPAPHTTSSTMLSLSIFRRWSLHLFSLLAIVTTRAIDLRITTSKECLLCEAPRLLQVETHYSPLPLCPCSPSLPPHPFHDLHPS